MDDQRVRIIRNLSESSSDYKMFRVRCDACEDYTYGNGRGRYQSYWVAKVGAQRAYLWHLNQHASKPKGRNVFGLVGDRREPNPELWHEVDSAPVVYLKD
jgi:hypothetical protein